MCEKCVISFLHSGFDIAVAALRQYENEACALEHLDDVRKQIAETIGLPTDPESSMALAEDLTSRLANDRLLAAGVAFHMDALIASASAVRH
jgi:hypothetical protein